jgi:SAM-dependent methyltransferase
MVDDKFKHDMDWEEKAKRNPLYAVMSHQEIFAEKDADPGKWTKEDLDKFFSKGQLLFNAFIRPVLLRAEIDPAKAFVVEYGSGLGTILKAVKAAGYDCAGIDISPTMLEFSRKVTPEITRLSALDQNGSSDIPSNSADMVYTRAVMQHIKDFSNVKTAIAEMCRIVKPGGYLKMHFRTHSNLPFAKIPLAEKRWVFNFETRSAMIFFFKRPWLPLTAPVLGMVKHTNWAGTPLSMYNLRKLLTKNGMDLLGIEKDIGGKHLFYWALARKKK